MNAATQASKIEVKFDGQIEYRSMAGNVNTGMAVVDAQGNRYLALSSATGGSSAWDLNPEHDSVPCVVVSEFSAPDEPTPTAPAAPAIAIAMLNRFHTQVHLGRFVVGDDATHFAHVNGHRSKPLDHDIAVRLLIERAVVRRAVTDILAMTAQGDDGQLAPAFTLDVHDGEETTVRKSRDLTEIMDALGTVDEESIVVRRADTGKYVGSIYLVYGNDGWDVMADYSMSLDEMLKGASELGNQLGDAAYTQRRVDWIGCRSQPERALTADQYRIMCHDSETDTDVILAEGLTPEAALRVYDTVTSRAFHALYAPDARIEPMNHDLTTFVGWERMAYDLIDAYDNLYGDSDGWTALVDAKFGGFVVQVDGELCTCEGTVDAERTYELDDMGEVSWTAWDGNAWDGSTPEDTQSVLTMPLFRRLAHAE